MNQERRKMLRGIIADMGGLRAKLEELAEAENAAVEALPESLQNTERAERMQEVADMLQNNVDGMESIEDELTECLE